MLKEAKAGEWWVDPDDDYIVLIIGLDSDGDPVFEDKYSCFDSYRSEVFHNKFKYEPDCDGFGWVKPVPVVVESPDDLVVQDRVSARIGIDKGWWSASYVTPDPAAHWFDVNSNHTGMMHRHQCTDRTALNLCCRRSQLPVPEPKKTRIELRLWVNKFTGEIVHDPSMNETGDEWHEVLFDSTGQPYYLKD